MKHGILITVDRPELFSDQSIARLSDGRTFTVIPRRSGKLACYPYRQMRKGMPWSLPVPAWVTDRIDELRCEIYGSEDW